MFQKKNRSRWIKDPITNKAGRAVATSALLGGVAWCRAGGPDVRFFFSNILAVFGVALLACSAAHAAEDSSPKASPHRLGLSIGAVHAQAREDLLVRTRWDGPGAQLDFFYHYDGGAQRHEVVFPFAFVYESNRFGDGGASILSGLKYTGLAKIFSDDAWGNVWIGGVLDWDLNDDYYFSWDEEHLYWLTTYALGPVAEWRYAWGELHSVSARLSLPLVALASRPPEHRFYKIGELNHPSYFITKPHDDIEAVSWDRWFAFDISAEYLYRAGEIFFIGAGYALEFKTHAEPRRISRLNNIFLFRMAWALGVEEGSQ